MGSQVGIQDEITVLVTGFGPFREQYPINPSWEIAKDLPSYLPPLRAKDAKSRGAADIPPVRILVYPEPIRVNYQVVRRLVPSLWETYQGRKVDVVIHIGMAGPRPYYCIERRGHRDGYEHTDVDGEKVDQSPGDDWIWRGLPTEIETELDMEDILKRWKEHSAEDMDLRISEDAGRYLCDFIYYSSLSHLYKEQRERKVVFLHVPADASPANVDQGRELAINLIRSIVESEVIKKKGEQETAVGDGQL